MAADELARVLAAAQARDAARVELTRAVQSARSAGHSWAELGRLMGMSRQAVFKKFSHLDDLIQPAEEPRPGPQAVRAAEQVFLDLRDGQVQNLSARLVPAAAEVLTAQVLTETWAQVVAMTGPPSRLDLLALEQNGRLVDATADVVGAVVVELGLICERGWWRGRVALTGQDLVTGVLILPPGETRAAF